MPQRQRKGDVAPQRVSGNDDAVKSIRIIVDTVVAAIQGGLAQRESQEPLAIRRPSGLYETLLTPQS